MELAYFQIPAFLSEGEKNISTTGKLEKCVLREFPLYYYSGFIEAAYMEQEDSLLAELMTRNEGTDEDYKNIDEESLDYDDDALHIEGSMLEELEKENRVHNTGDDENQDGVGKINEEDSILAGPSGEFRRPDYPAYTYDWAEQQSNESLISNFFAVDSSTLLDEKYLDLDKLLYEDLSVDKTVDGPQILIYHTHSREAFEDSVEGDPSTTIVGAGERLAYLLQEELKNTDILIVATGASVHTITEDMIPYDKQLTIIDMSVPENVVHTLASRESIQLVNVDGLSKMVDDTIAQRRNAVPEAIAIIDEYSKDFYEWLENREFVPAIQLFKNRLDFLQQHELNNLRKDNIEVSEQEIMLTNKLMQKITNQFASFLIENRDDSKETIELIEKMFHLKQA